MSNRSKTIAPTLALLITVGSPPAQGDTAAIYRALADRADAPAARASEAGAKEKALLGPATPEEIFSMDGADNSPAVRSFPDINSDGRDEILVGIDESGTDNIFLLDGASTGTATVLWSVETMDGVSGGSPYGDLSLTVVPDADGNGIADVLAGTAWGGRTAYRMDGASGAIQWRLDTYLEADSGWVYSLAEVGDVAGDSKPEVAFGAGSDNDRVYLIDGSSTGGAQGTVRWRYSAADGVLALASPGDLSGDGLGDVVAAVGDQGQAVVALNGATASPSGEVLWQYSVGASPFALGVLPDITGDGIDEILAAVWVSTGDAIRCLNGATGALEWASTTVFAPGMLVDLLEDVTGDGIPEVIASSWENAVSVLNGADGTEVWKTTVGNLNGGDVWTARAIGDLNADGKEDVIAGSFDYNVYAMDGDSGDILWAFDTANRVFSVHAVGDLNNDGWPEVVAGTQDTNNNTVIHVLSGIAAFGIFGDGFESGDSSAWSMTFP
ncbi:MAG: FG-GAP-like repeat-containing protein [Deltaproteobacteria bacterium]|nr:FG-GAP-like repeat-containing protein [Deltaproteobacteria bacterium]